MPGVGVGFGSLDGIEVVQPTTVKAIAARIKMDGQSLNLTVGSHRPDGDHHHRPSGSLRVNSANQNDVC